MGVLLYPQERGQLSNIMGTQDDTVILGNFDVNLVPLLRWLITDRAQETFLFPQGMAKYKMQFDLAVKALGLERFELVTYQARHGGASRDIMMQRRDLEEVRKRGQWRTYTSVRRYEKSGRVHKVLQTTPPPILKYCLAVAPRLLTVLLGRTTEVPAPPVRR